MMIQILEIIRSWHFFAQLLFAMFIATLGTLIMVSVIGAVGDFFNNSLPTLIRGYPPSYRDEGDETDTKE